MFVTKIELEKFRQSYPAIAIPMENEAITKELEVLDGVSDRLEKLADAHPVVSEGLLRVANIVRNLGVLLVVLGAKVEL
jgi:hypothetical protein